MRAKLLNLIFSCFFLSAFISFGSCEFCLGLEAQAEPQCHEMADHSDHSSQSKEKESKSENLGACCALCLISTDNQFQSPKLIEISSHKLEVDFLYQDRTYIRYFDLKPPPPKSLFLS